MFYAYFFPKALDLPLAIRLPRQTETEIDLPGRVENAESSYRAEMQREGGFLVLVTGFGHWFCIVPPRKEMTNAA